MAEAALALASYERTGGIPTILENAFPEAVSTPQGVRHELRARPGMLALATVGSGPLRAAHQRDGLFSNAALILSGQTLYTLTDAGVATAFAGSVLGSSLPDIDSNLTAELESEAWIATGAALCRAYNGVVSPEDFPEAGGAGASSVCTLLSFVFATEAGTDKVYARAPGETAWDPLSFASAEHAPDPVVAVRTVGELLAILGTSTFEAWSVSSGTPEPFGGLTANVGCRSKDTARVIGERLVFVDNQSQVRTWQGGALNIISDPGLVEEIAATDADDLCAWGFATEGHEFYCLTLAEGATWVHDLTGPPGRWFKWDSSGLDYWRAKLGCNIGDAVVATDALTNQVWQLVASRKTDGDEVFDMRFSALIPPSETPTPCANVVLIAKQGAVPLSGQGSDPQVGLMWSDNDGATWRPGGWKWRPMGGIGQPAAKPRWNALGTVPAQQSRLLLFLISDPIGRVVRQVLYNVGAV